MKTRGRRSKITKKSVITRLQESGVSGWDSKTRALKSLLEGGVLTTLTGGKRTIICALRPQQSLSEAINLLESLNKDYL